MGKRASAGRTRTARKFLSAPFTGEERDRAHAKAKRLGITTAELLRRAVIEWEPGTLAKLDPETVQRWRTTYLLDTRTVAEAHRAGDIRCGRDWDRGDGCGCPACRDHRAFRRGSLGAGEPA